LRALLLEDGDGLGIGVAGVNDERYARLVRRGDMGAKARFLLGARAMLIVEIEPGLADADHLGIARKPNEGIARDVGFLRRLVRVNADRAPDIAVAFGDRAHGREFLDLGADGDKGLDPCPLGARDDLGPLGLGREIEMAMAIDDHNSFTSKGGYSTTPSQSQKLSLRPSLLL